MGLSGIAGAFARIGLFILVLALPVWTAAATLSAGGDHGCAIDAGDGALRCWGRGQLGQLGNGLTVHHAAPSRVTGGEALRAVASGGSHSCGLTAAGGVRCWGDNASGQLGDGSTLFRSTPTPVTGLGAGVIALALGTRHSCVLLQSGQVQCWGESDDGRLGSGHTSDQTAPQAVIGLTDAAAISAGGEHTCARLAGGGVACWGANASGQLGDGSWTTRTTPVAVAVGQPVQAIAAGGTHTCALGSAGAVLCWGRNAAGQLGDGTGTHRNLPVIADGLAGGATRLAAGGAHTCALASGAQLRCWGYNNYGQLGDGTTASANRPVAVAGLSGPVLELAAGTDHTCIRGSANAIRCWGSTEYGKGGYGDTGWGNLGYSTRPQPIGGLPAPAAALSLRARNGCAVTVEGGAVCWGSNVYGQVGDGMTTGSGNGVDQAGPRAVAGLEAGVRAVAAGEHHACAVRGDGSVWCWGRNQYGQVADGTTITRRTPVRLAGLDGVIAIAAGLSFSCALDAGGGVRCWGRNQVGQLGDGSLVDRNAPTPVAGLSSGVVALSLGQQHACARLGDGTLRCWGRNNRGQVGDGSTTDRLIPTAVADAGIAYAAVHAGGEHSCGLTNGGQVRCWGYNGSGQLGDGTVTTRPLPTGVDGLTAGVTALAVGDYHGCALRGDGQVVCWGYNNRYQLGDGSTTTRRLPVAVLGLDAPVTALRLGEESSCALQADGRARCWGNGAYGQLGNGAIDRYWSEPVEIARWTRSDRIFAYGFEP